MPTTTVLMAVHNAAPFLEDAVASVFNQTFVDFEFLVVDDGSTDNTGAMLAQLTDPRLRVISLENNVGLVAALNVGIEEARGDLIARMDGDDVCEPRRLELGPMQEASRLLLGAIERGLRKPSAEILQQIAAASTEVASLVIRFSVIMLSSTAVLFAASLLLQAETARAAPATRIRARIQDSLIVGSATGIPSGKSRGP